MTIGLTVTVCTIEVIQNSVTLPTVTKMDKVPLPIQMVTTVLQVNHPIKVVILVKWVVTVVTIGIGVSPPTLTRHSTTVQTDLLGQITNRLVTTLTVTINTVTTDIGQGAQNADQA
jgi:hypothetical protein